MSIGLTDNEIAPRFIKESNLTGRNSLEVETRAVLRAEMQEKYRRSPFLVGHLDEQICKEVTENVSGMDCRLR